MFQILGAMYLLVKYIGGFFIVVYIFIFLVFSSSDTDVDYSIPQNIGGSLVVKGIEKDHYEACEYEINLFYKFDNSTVEHLVGKLEGYTRNRDVCVQMGLYNPSSIYSDIQIKQQNSVYEITFSDKVNQKQIFTSLELKKWNKKT